MANEQLKFINERMCIDLAHRIKALGGKATLDDVLPECAASAVLIDFKHEDERELKILMLAIKQFVSRNNRFINLAKAAIIEGLRAEWLLSLDFERKRLLLSDNRIVDDVDSDGYIIVNEKFYNAYVNIDKPDRGKYGTMAYEPKTSTHRAARRIKTLLTTVEPDPQLSEKMRPYIEWFKGQFRHICSADIEGYKWQAVEIFQKTFDIDAADLSENLKVALKGETNLLSGGSFNFAKNTLLRNARFSQEDVRFVLRNLFDESEPLADRVNAFINRFTEIHEANRKAGNFKPNESVSQNEHSISVLLAFRYPSQHYIYKFTDWNTAKAKMGLDYPSLANFPCKLRGYELICDQIRKVLIADAELVALHNDVFPADLSDFHLLTQTFIYSIVHHFESFDKPSIH